MLDPASLAINLNAVRIFYLGRNYERAICEASELLKLQEDYSGAYYFLGLIYDQVAQYEQAAWAYHEYNRLVPDDVEAMANMCLSHAMAGRTSEAHVLFDKLSALAEQQHVPPYLMAFANGGLGNTEEGYAWLEKAYEMRDTNLLVIKVDPRVDSLRSHAKFSILAGRLFNGSSALAEKSAFLPEELAD
jgi:tetratricopeptide (TPR) repeat protein